VPAVLNIVYSSAISVWQAFEHFLIVESRENSWVPWNPADFQNLPLSASECVPKELPAGLLSTPAEQLFPHGRDAKAALAGLLLLYGHWDLSHQVSQDVDSREGSYWHAIAHRIEPDSWNSGYWFRRVGEHPIFSQLRADTEAMLTGSKTGWRMKKAWDPALFNTWCDEARGFPGSEKHRLACQIQRQESDLLFSWCAVKTKDF
jgi:hypothetical protein